jgi:integrase
MKANEKPKRLKLDIGTVYQKAVGECFYFRYQVNGQRKAVSLQTRNQDDALAKARGMVPVVRAPSLEVVAAHVSHAKGLARKGRRLELKEAWSVYDKHPNRAHPATVSIYLRYKVYFAELVSWATAKGCRYLDEITDAVVAEFVGTLRDQEISVDTHNKRIARTAHIFKTLADYVQPTTSTWTNPNFRRKAREEIGITARRLPFTKDQEEQLFAALEDPRKRCKNKAEIRALFYLGAFTGQRMKDCALLQWHKVDMTRQRIGIVQFKTEKEVTIPVAPRLLQVLKEAEEWKRDSYVLPSLAVRYLRVDANGKDNGAGFVNHDVMRVIRWIGLEPSVKVSGRLKSVCVYGFHSLRHSFASFCIDNNIPKAVAESMLGANTGIIDQYYTHIGEDAQEQAIQLINGSGTSVKQRQERVLEYLGQIQDKTPELAEIERILRG